jgi:hypothetical protein
MQNDIIRKGKDKDLGLKVTIKGFTLDELKAPFEGINIIHLHGKRQVHAKNAKKTQRTLRII